MGFEIVPFNQNGLIIRTFRTTGGAKIPLSRGAVLDPVQNAHIVPPGQLCNKLLHNVSSGLGLGQRTHVAEVPRAEPFDSRRLSLQIPSEPVDNLAAPLLSRKTACSGPGRSTNKGRSAPG
jgi:hypothetical protein